MAAAEPIYDLMLLLDTARAGRAAREDPRRRRALITSNGGAVSPSTTGARARLAFEIRHKTDAEYHLIQFQGPRPLSARTARCGSPTA